MDGEQYNWAIDLQLLCPSHPSKFKPSQRYDHSTLADYDAVADQSDVYFIPLKYQLIEKLYIIIIMLITSNDSGGVLIAQWITTPIQLVWIAH